MVALTEVKCGGVVVRQIKTLLVASSANTSLVMDKKTITKTN
jgi:hypothetical protein